MARSSASGRPRTRTSTRRGGSTGSSTACSRPTGSRSRRSPTSWTGWRRRTASTSRRPRTARWGSGHSPWPLSEGSSVPSTTSSGSAAVPTTPTSCGEVYVRTRELAVTLNPALGGAITELGYLAGDLDVADVLARRPEAYHAKVRGASPEDGAPAVRTIHDAPAPKEAGLDSLLAYDDVRRGSLLEGWFDAGTSSLDPVSPWAQAALALATEALASTVSAASGGVAVTF